MNKTSTVVIFINVTTFNSTFFKKNLLTLLNILWTNMNQQWTIAVLLANINKDK